MKENVLTCCIREKTGACINPASKSLTQILNRYIFLSTVRAVLTCLGALEIQHRALTVASTVFMTVLKKSTSRLLIYKYDFLNLLS